MVRHLAGCHSARGSASREHFNEFERYLLTARGMQNRNPRFLLSPIASVPLHFLQTIFTSVPSHFSSLLLIIPVTCSLALLLSSVFSPSDQSLYLLVPHSSLIFRFIVHFAHATPFPYCQNCSSAFLLLQMAFTSFPLQPACFSPQQSKLLWISKAKFISVGLYVLCVWVIERQSWRWATGIIPWTKQWQKFSSWENACLIIRMLTGREKKMLILLKAAVW